MAFGVALLAACSTIPVSQAEPTTLTLKVGESLVVPGTNTALTVLRLTDDSRCPESVTCVWAGNAQLELTGGLAMPGIPPGGFPRRLVNTNLAPNVVTIGELDVRLLDVLPHRADTTPFDSLSKQLYTVVLQIRAAGSSPL